MNEYMNDDNKYLFTRAFWLAALVRAIRTIAQTMLALIGTNAVGITSIDWVGVASGAALAGVVSILTSVATGIPEAKRQLPEQQTEEETQND